MLKSLISITLLSLLISSANAHQSHSHSLFKEEWKMIASFETDNFHKDFEVLSKLDFDIAGVDHKHNIIDVLIGDIGYEVLKNLGYDLEISHIKGLNTAPDSQYHNPSEIEVFVKRIHREYPEITKLISIGKSIEGRDIWALKISDNANEHEFTEPALLFNSMHHAREIMTPEVGIDIIETLTLGYGENRKITNWVDQNEIWVIPMFNVDGNNKMWKEDSWWRKNTRGGYGVDLNRNYPTGWNSCNGSSGRRSSQTYRGESPASEPETQAMMSFVSDTRPVFDISYHSYSELVIYPYGCAEKRTANKEVVEKIGKKIADLLDYKAGTAWELLYNADGGDIDWMYDTYQVIPYVIELNSRWQGFHPNYNKWRDRTVNLNKKGWQYLLDRVSKSGVRGQALFNGVPLAESTITIYKTVDGKDIKFYEYTTHKTGMFHIVLNPGEYALEIKAGTKALVVRTTIGDTLQKINLELNE